MNADEIRTRLTAARDRRDGIVPATSDDPAVARLSGAALRQFHRSTDTALARYTAACAEVDDLEFKLARAEADEREAARTKLTVADVKGARAVRDRFGWHKVVRVSAKSVTVETPYSWTDRIAIDKILQVAS